MWRKESPPISLGDESVNHGESEDLLKGVFLVNSFLFVNELMKNPVKNIDLFLNEKAKERR